MAKSYQDQARKIKEVKQKMPPMNWYFFIIYVQLFLTAISDLSTAYLYMSKRYLVNQGIEPAAFYAATRGYRTLDILFALLNIVTAVLAVYVRFRMKKLKKGSWRQYLQVTLLGLFQIVFYMAGRAIILLIHGITLSLAEYVYYLPQIIGGIGIYFISESYFEKRDYLFVN